ncbi:MAG: hypothetical protein S4CHLAM7_15220 [Chlamydiae bacterium]|nr:hypothetical protein [Chlamydiota bacterium]
MKKEKTLRVLNKQGIHTRPASLIAKLLAKTNSMVYFTCNSRTVDAKQVMNLLLLEAKMSHQIKVKVEGNDAETVVKELSALFEQCFGEKP